DEVVEGGIVRDRGYFRLIFRANGFPVDAVEPRIVIVLVDGLPYLFEDHRAVSGRQGVRSGRILQAAVGVKEFRARLVRERKPAQRRKQQQAMERAGYALSHR